MTKKALPAALATVIIAMVVGAVVGASVFSLASGRTAQIVTTTITQERVTTISVTLTVTESLPPGTGTPTTASASLEQMPLGRLFWGADRSTGKSWTTQPLASYLLESDEVGRTTRRVLEKAVENLAQEVKAVEKLELEGLIFNDPRYVSSVETRNRLSLLQYWALCGRLAGGTVGGLCQSKAIGGLMAWVNTYKPTGNPIDEQALVPLILAYDLLRINLSDDQNAKAEAWLAELAKKGDANFENWTAQGSTKIVNNWNTYRLLIRALVANVLDNVLLKDSTRTMVKAHLDANILDDGPTFDFVQRDALHYHTYNLEAWIQLLLFAPNLVPGNGRARVLVAIEFIKPFFLGERIHTEFLNSKVRFDIVRREAGDPDFAKEAWKPQKARRLLRLAEAYYPEVRPWTASVVDENYEVFLKLTAALQRR